MKRLGLVLAGILMSMPVHADEPQGVAATHILDLNDADSLIVLKVMALAGDNRTKLLAEAWNVLSSIAIGEGRLSCGFPDETAKTMWQPALDGMNKHEIYELKRLVTANFRNAENGSVLDSKKFFPVSRQAVNLFKDRSGAWTCASIRRFQEKSDLYVHNNTKVH